MKSRWKSQVTLWRLSAMAWYGRRRCTLHGTANPYFFLLFIIRLQDEFMHQLLNERVTDAKAAPRKTAIAVRELPRSRDL